MSTPRNRSSRSATVVVLLALVLGAAGFTGTAYGAALTAKQVKKIAAKVVKNQAPKLSVKFAETAGSAATAGSATTATTAGNALNLGGVPPTTYLDRVIGSSITSAANVDNAVVTQVLNPNTISVPPGVGFVRVDAVVALSPVGNTGMSMWIQRNGPCIDSGADFENRQFGHTSTQDSISLTRLITVAPGDHSFRMCVIAGADTSVDNRSMVVQTVAVAG